MSNYGQKNYKDKQGGGNGGKPAAYTIAQIGCFITAFCNLLKRKGKDVDPASLNRLFTQRGIYIDVDDGVKDDVSWQTITAYDGQLRVTRTAAGGWPGSNDAIIKFRYLSKQTGKMTSHFCLVEDAAAHTFIDSYDGVVKTVAQTSYGEPVAYAEYDAIVAQPIIPATPVVAPSTPGTTHIVAKGETLSGIATKYKTTYQILAEMNDIADPSKIYPGKVLRLPVSSQSVAKPDESIEYELLPTPRQVHVSKADGAEKWGFGGVKAWKDFVSTGRVAVNTNVEVVAIAHVKVGLETAAYYMDKAALGDYMTTGRVANTIGFNWRDVADGFITAETPPKMPEGVVEIIVQAGWGISHVLKAAGYPKESYERPEEWDRTAMLNGSTERLKLKPGQKVRVFTTPMVIPQPIAPVSPTPTPVAAPAIDPLPPTNPLESPTSNYKTTLKNFATGPKEFYAKESIMVREFDFRRPDRQLIKNQPITIDGTFEKDGILFGRPAAAAKAGLWFGIPMDGLVSEEEIFDYNLKVSKEPIPNSTVSSKESFLNWLSGFVTRIVMTIRK